MFDVDTAAWMLDRYTRDRYAFVTECCRTIDEVAVDTGEDKYAMAASHPETVKLIPKLPHIRRMVLSWEQHRLIAYLKSRRLIATWTLLALDLHLAMFGKHAAIYVINTDQAKSDELLSRIVFMYDHLPDGFPKPVMKIHKGHEGNPTRIDFPGMSSFIKAVSQEPDALRSLGATVLHVEELAFWQWPEESWQAMLPTIQGGGKMVIVSTIIANSFYQQLVMDELQRERSTPGTGQPMLPKERGLKIGSFPLPVVAENQGQGMAGWQNPHNNFYIQLIHYTADPHKRSQEWYTTTKTGYTERIWEQEYEINPENWLGLPVFSEFIRHYHVAREPLGWWKAHESPMLRLWDVGTHACVWAQAHKGRFYIFDSRQTVGAFVDKKTGMNSERYQDYEVEGSGLGLFIDECLRLSDEWFEGAVWRDIIDPSAWNQNIQHEKRSIQLFTARGLNPVKGVQSIEVRITAVNEWLQRSIRGEPGLQIDPGARVIIDGFAGGYAMENRGGEMLPDKGAFSHSCNSVEYGCTRHPAPGASRVVMLAKAKAENDAFVKQQDRVAPWRGLRPIQNPDQDNRISY